MKPMLKTRFVAVITTAILLLVLSSSCKKDKNPVVDQTKKVTVQLSGSQEVPSNNSTGTGTAQITFDPVSKIITYNMSWQLGSTTATTTNMHFHGAENGSDLISSGVVIGITGFTTASSGTISGSTRALTDVEVNQLLAGKWYLNIHSSTIQAGELRGNIKF
ncbi:CHRD domain-containing protein [Pedobacter sp. P351]|uniref:CHRD domain-containing protein n=1 Tax=Pedobacter superstes TaxID=3133441 RepID=UPI00309525DE